ncbi:MAG: hypothetical protein ABEI80_04165 [Haloplanus sp.]
MYVSRHRDASFASAGLASLLYFFLFWGVYSPLLGRGLPALQLAFFFSVPLVASSLVLGSAKLRDWETDMIADAGTELGDVISDIEERRETFEDEFEDRVGDLDALQGVAPTGVERAREDRRAFLDELESLRDRAVEARAIDDAEEMLRRTNELSERTAELDPVATVDRIVDRLREKVASGVRYSFGTVRVPSRYDETYVVVNLPARLREVELDPLDATVHIDRVDDVLLDRLESSDSLASVAEATAAAQSHLDDIESYVYEREAAFAETESAVKDDLETVRERVERLESPLAERASELLVEGRHDEVDGVSQLERELADARERLHECQFDDAERIVERTGDRSGDLATLAEFLDTAVASARAGSERIPVPDVDGADAVLPELVEALERTVGADCRVTDGVIAVDRVDADGAAADEAEAVAASASTTGDAEARGDDPSESGSDRGSGTDVGAEEVLDAVLYVYRELESNVEADDDRTARCHTDGLPESVTRPEVFEHAVRFANRQTDLVAEARSEMEGGEGFVEIRPVDDAVPRRSIRTLYERYRETYT